MLKLRFACQAYDWAQPIMDGSIRPEGIEITAEASFPAQTFARVLGNGEFDFAELGLTYYIGTLENEDPPFVSIPVFPVRLFRLSSIYVRAGSAIRAPEDLIGKRYGEFFTYGHDAGVWVRGMLRDHYGVALDSHATFSIGGVGEPLAELEWLPFQWPAGARAEHIGPDRTLDAMLEAGEIDVLLSALEPPGVNDGSGSIRRLFDDAESAEREIFKKTGVFPIMHTVAIRKEIYRENPWVARSLYQAFEQARAKVQDRERVREYVPLTRMIPLYLEHQREILDLMGEDYWPYGVEANRTTLDAFLGYHHDLGLSKRRFKLEDLFVTDALS